jgi:carboxyl-terminal processing protease
MWGRASWRCLVLGALLASACTPQQAFTPRLTSSVPPTPTAQPAAVAGLTAEDGLDLVLEAWSRLVDSYVDSVDPAALLHSAWDGMGTALPAGQPRPPYPAATPAPSGTPTGPGTVSAAQAELQRFRRGYLAAAAQSSTSADAQSQLANAAIRKMVESLNDCLTSFTDAVTVQQQMAQVRGETRMGGVGIRIKHKPNEPILIWELLEGGSAGKAGIKPGDAIVKVDGKDVTSLTLEQIASSIRGPEGSQVKLTVERADGKRTQDFSLKRAPLNEPTFQTRWLKGDVAYFRLLGFSPTVQAELLASLRDYEPKNPKGWIFDLRTNASGDYPAMLSMLSKVLKDGPFAYEQDKQGRRGALGPDGTYLPRQHPYVVLVSDSTSSAAEVFAAAVESANAGTVIGTRTAGCAGVGSRLQLGDGSVLSVATRRVMGPGALEINRQGITPKTLVEVSRGELAAGKDPQLDRALAVLSSPTR